MKYEIVIISVDYIRTQLLPFLEKGWKITSSTPINNYDGKTSEIIYTFEYKPKDEIDFDR